MTDKERTGEIKQCNICKKNFYVPKYRINTAKFCSTSCANADKRKYKSERELVPDINYKYYYLYRTINIINGKEYIGIHRSNTLNDGYIGNGIKSETEANRRFNNKQDTVFCKAVVKYGYKNFKREILAFLDNYEDLLELEELIVNLDYIKQTNNYNVSEGGKAPSNIEQYKYYDLTNEQGVIFKGYGINKFCLENNLSMSGIAKVVQGVLHKSQGFVRTENYVNNKIRIVNLKTENTYLIDNITKWSKEFHPEFIMKGAVNKLVNVLVGRSAICNNEWWACYESDWNNIVKIDLNRLNNMKRFHLSDNKNNIYIVENVRDFCKNNNIKDICSFYYLLRGKIKKYKGYKLVRQEFIFNNVNKEGTEIYIKTK